MTKEENDTDGDKDQGQVHFSVTVARMHLSSSPTDASEIKKIREKSMFYLILCCDFNAPEFEPDGCL